jgi:hypothetical protein
VVSITPPEGYDCGTESVTVSVTEATPDPDVEFTCVAPVGSFMLSLSGLSSGLALEAGLDGPVNRTGSLGSAGVTFTDLPLGDYTWGYPQLAGWLCTPANGTFTLSTAGQAVSEQVSCEATEGSLQVAVFGATADVSYSGPESGSGAVGETPVEFAGLVPGNYTVNVSSPAGFDCLPESQQAAVTAGASATVQFECTPLTGTVTATVQGATAQVNYTGAASGGATVGDTPVPFTGLPAGSYTFAIVEPDGFDCTPASIPVNLVAGGMETAQFTCSEEPEELVEYSIDLAGFQGAPGMVASGTYLRPVRDALLVAVATMAINTIGVQTFFGTSPNRLGFDGSSGYEIDALFQVAALVFTVRALQVCTLNAALSGSNFLALTYYSAALALLGSASITSAPGCFWLNVPLGTRFIRMLGPAVGFVDINGLKVRGVVE